MAAILGNSRAVVAELVEEGAPAEHLRLIYNGVNLSEFEKIGDRDSARAVLGIPPTALVMTVVANLIPYKGHDDLLEALSAVKLELPDEWLMLWVGSDSGIAEELLSKAKSYGLEEHLRWLAQRDDVPGILLASDVGLLCSHEEGFSNSLLEGMAASLPMIVTDVGGNAEAVLDGVCGRVVPAKSPWDLSRAIAELSENPELRARMGKAGRERVEKRFSLARCVACYDELYRQLESGSARSLENIVGDDKG
jgi:glycosyltransferase involved in cell wall biosynthesis